MNIDKVNAILGKALIHIQLAESEVLRSVAEDIAFGDDDGPTDFVSAYVDSVARTVSEAAEVSVSHAGNVVIEAMEELASEHPVTVRSTADIAAWATSTGLADEIARRLS